MTNRDIMICKMFAVYISVVIIQSVHGSKALDSHCFHIKIPKSFHIKRLKRIPLIGLIELLMMT